MAPDSSRIGKTVMTPLKPFQQATVDVVVRALSDRRRKVRRFLVADEVGLGKTVIAQHAIDRLMQRQNGPLTVFYVCSNLSIAGQNRQKLLQVLPDGEQNSAYCQVDRLTLLPASGKPSHPKLHLYTLTPDTSVPVRNGHRRDGRQEERALLQALVEDAYPYLFDALGWKEDFFQRHAQARWPALVEWYRNKVANSGLRASFKEAVRMAFGLEPGQWLQTKLRSITDDLEVIAGFRSALAIQALGQLKPDLVIFDEFQRFRDLINKDLDDAASRIVSVLRGDEGSALLMLSATPYSLQTSREEDADGSSHHEQLLDLVDFLYGRGSLGKAKVEACRQAFGLLEASLHKGDCDVNAARKAVSDVESLLRPVMARTERLMHPHGKDDGHTLLPKAPLVAADLQSFRHFNESLDERDRTYAASYWSSIPMPMQTMGNRYEVWARSNPVIAPRLPALDVEKRDKFRLPGPWPHPKLRAVMDMAKPEALALPWVAPSLPWWDLAGPWCRPEAIRGKILVFSRFRAVPPALSAALSYEVERKYLHSKPFEYPDVPKRRMLQATGERMPLLAAFHPSLLIASSIDPLLAKSASRKDIHASIKSQLTELLRERLGIEIENRSIRKRPVWQLMAGLEASAGVFDKRIATWRVMQARIGRATQEDGESEDSAGQSGLARLIDKWLEADQQIVAISEAELDELVNHAWSAPGIILARALARHWSTALDESNFEHLLTTSWQGLRTYLDQRWFAALLGGSEKNYLRQLQIACIDGNLESVLDEWFWMLGTTQGRKGADLCDELMGVARIRGSDVHLHDVSSKSKESGFTLRAHAALPFIDMRQRQLEMDTEAKPIRNDELRRAFNSPFHPHVLTTTSVGQEGLDFHGWCRTVVHWDLAPNAADLEQREGRIQRFAGLAIRREIAQRIGRRAIDYDTSNLSPWRDMAIKADQEMGDASGMAPWWVCEGARIDRCVFDVPASEQRAKLDELHAQRGLYRIVIGQPYQEDLMALLKRKQAEGQLNHLDLIPVLSPYFRPSSSSGGEDSIAEQIDGQQTESV